MSKINDVDNILAEDEIRFVFEQVENALVDRPNSTIINFGPGPCNSAGLFVEKLVAKCGKIVLVEISEIFCAEYVQSEWYNKHREKITILNASMESAMESGVFDNEDTAVLFLSNVLYYVQLKSMRQVFDLIAQYIVQHHTTAIIVVASQMCPHMRAFCQFYNYQHLAVVCDQVERLRAMPEYCVDAHATSYRTFSLKDVQYFLLADVVAHPDYMNLPPDSPQAREVSGREAKRVFDSMSHPKELNTTYIIKEKV